MEPQLSLFDQDFVAETKIFEKANELIDLLNDGYKEKDRYWATGIFKHRGYYIFRANQNGKKPVFNILDSDGNIPAGFEVNWRIWSCILHNLKTIK